ncbi:hypothetical protein C8J27_1096 [Rhodobacter aestuarii]|uniref:Uncharacterized protein n=1 Tax=Rhodobacter aestuarii TaxID=453582 RepID=A0A1N7PWM7_9RHOB|nr:hypothetical protein [Rhodobacter aestuarii]PTV94109.1 hypothetical protein C8J27_1096 [Rhodobacter aestuarii]SIT14955.1 hypothetical protein SAMN05421580_111129 [Rhodobacter aestuarii]
MDKQRDTSAPEGRLIERVGKFMAPVRDYRKHPVETFNDWLALVFTEFFNRETGAAFAPFNDRFEGRLEFPEAFCEFVRVDVSGQRVGEFDARALVVNYLASRLGNALQDFAPFERTGGDGRLYIRDYPLLLFKALRLLDGERACEWAASATRTMDGAAIRWTIDRQPLPVALYYEMRGRAIAGPNRQDFNDAFLEWCDKNCDLKGGYGPAFAVLLDVLRVRKAQERIALVHWRQDLLFTICTGILRLDEVMGTDCEKLSLAAKQLRKAFGSDGIEKIAAMFPDSKEKWNRNPLLVEAFGRELVASEGTGAEGGWGGVEQTPAWYTETIQAGGALPVSMLREVNMGNALGGGP